MTKLLLTLMLIVSTVSSAGSHLVINGLKTDDFKPVVKLRFGSGSLCTGTFISKQIILTAAHCIDGYYRKLLTHASFHSVPPVPRGRKISYKIYINDEEFSRVEDIYKMPMDNTKMLPSGSYKELNQRLAELTKPLEFHFGQKKHPFANNKQMYQNDEIDLYRKAFYSVPNTLSSPVTDIAFIKVKYRPYDQHYKLSQNKLYESAKVKAVGYGLSMTPSQMMKLSLEYYKYEAKAKNASFGFTKKQYEKTLKDVNAKIEKDKSGVKRHGDNIIDAVEAGVYYLAGKAQAAQKSWNSFTKIFYSWDKADGRQVTVSSGDSGGPLLKKIGDEYIVYGVASMIFDFSTKESLDYFKKQGLNIKSKYKGKAISVYSSTFTDDFNQFYKEVVKN